MSLPKIHLLSFPRSGNHALRAILEYSSGRPTLGCPNSGESDVPIYLRPSNREGLIQIRSTEPIAFKSHSIHETLYWDKKLDKELKLVLVTRDPLNSIFSQVYRKLRKKIYVSRDRVDDEVKKEISAYMSLVYLYCSFSNRPRLHIKFEDVFSKDSSISLESINSYLRFVDECIPQITRQELNGIFDQSKKSQRSLLLKRKAKLEKIIADSIREKIDYSDILDKLHSC